MDLISVIVPIYKVEEYLDRCVQSIVDQTYTNLEIILVDDGSPDRCPQMCDEWAKKDSRIRVLHKKNGGLSDARNAGMDIAKGDYIAFVDSDDWIEPNMYELLYRDMQKNSSDISACGVEMFWEDGSQPPRMLTALGTHTFNRDEAMSALLQETLLKQPVWYKLYKTEQIRDLLFPVGKYHEDAFWTYQAIARAKKVSVFDTPCYHYAQRSGSIMGESYSLRRLDSLEAKQQQLSFLERNMPSHSLQGRQTLLFSSLYAMQMSLSFLSGRDYREAKTKIHKIFKENLAKPLPKLPLKQRIWLLLAKINLTMTCRLRNLLKIGV